MRGIVTKNRGCCWTTTDSKDPAVRDFKTRTLIEEMGQSAKARSYPHGLQIQAHAEPSDAAARWLRSTRPSDCGVGLTENGEASP
jgi:hypothetical protein